MIKPPNQIEIRSFTKRGDMLVNTSALDPADPDHPYNQIVSLGLRPEHYGITHPHSEEFAHQTREQLVEEIINLRRSIEAMER